MSSGTLVPTTESAAGSPAARRAFIRRVKGDLDAALRSGDLKALQKLSGWLQTQDEETRAQGHPRREPPPDAAVLIQKAAAEGRPIRGVARAIGTSYDTLARWLREYPDLQEAFEAGRESERHELHQILVRDARDSGKPNINAIFLLKARHGYREGDPVDGAKSRLNITFNMPGALSKDDYLKTVAVVRQE